MVGQGPLQALVATRQGTLGSQPSEGWYATFSILSVQSVLSPLRFRKGDVLARTVGIGYNHDHDQQGSQPWESLEHRNGFPRRLRVGEGRASPSVRMTMPLRTLTSSGAQPNLEGSSIVAPNQPHLLVNAPGMDEGAWQRPKTCPATSICQKRRNSTANEWRTPPAHTTGCATIPHVASQAQHETRDRAPN